MADVPAPARQVAIEVRGERIVIRGDRSIYWPSRNWLIVADVHLGKVQSLRRDGVALPDAVMEGDLARLGEAMRDTGASRLLVLGDLVHDAHGVTPTLVSRVAAWRATIDAEVALVPGNHDRRVAGLPSEWYVAHLDDEVEEGAFRFSHDARDGAGFNWHGHIHPAVVLRGALDHLRLPCAVVGERAGILPAFSALTGGDVRAGRGAARIFAMAEGQVIALPSR